VSATLALSVDVLTRQAAWIAGLAVAALVLAGWRKPARAQARRPRSPDDRPLYVEIEHHPGPLYRRPGPVRRLLAAVAASGLALITGAVAATVLAFGVAWAVITLTGLLKN
jgi:hypothetical protein